MWDGGVADGGLISIDDTISINRSNLSYLTSHPTPITQSNLSPLLPSEIRFIKVVTVTPTVKQKQKQIPPKGHVTTFTVSEFCLHISLSTITTALLDLRFNGV